MARPRWRQVRRFCELQGYRATRTDHHYYDKVLADGTTSGTKVSFGRDGEEVPPGLWSRVWRVQLRLRSEEEFWKGLNGQPFEYDLPPSPELPSPLPPYLDSFLRNTLHFAEERVAATSRQEAQDLLNAYFSEELRRPIDAPE